MGMWHTLKNLTMSTRLFLEREPWVEERKGAFSGLMARKLKNPAGVLLEWEEGLHVVFPGEALGNGNSGLVR